MEKVETQEVKVLEGSRVRVAFEPAKLEIQNYDQMKQAIDNVSDFYANQIVTREGKKGAEASRSELIEIERQLEDERKRVKAMYNKPLNDYENKIKQLVESIRKPLNQIRDGLKEVEQGERDERESVLIRYLDEKLNGLEVEIDRPENWLNKGNFTQKGIASKLTKEIDAAIEEAVKEKKQKEVNEQVVRSFCETVEVESEGWLAQLDYKSPTEIMQTIQDKLKADKERLERFEREREELAELEKNNAETLQVKVQEPIKQDEPIIMDTIQVRGTLTKLKAMNAWAKENGIEISPYEPDMALDDLPF